MARQRGLPGWEEMLGLQEKDAAFSRHYQDILKKVFLNRGNEDKRTFVITSAVPSEGKTFTAINLAATLARTDRTLLVDANLLSPMAHRVFGTGECAGLAEVVSGKTQLGDAVITNRDLPSLHLLAAGGAGAAACGVLSPSKVGGFMEGLKSSYRYVLFDGPAVGATNDALLFSSFAEAVLLVVRSDSTQREEVLSAKFNIEKHGGNIAGVVLNRVPSYVPSFYRTM